VKKGVCAARALCDSVEFIAEDALRGDYTILIGCIKTAIEAGADTITICDPEGYALPAEMIAFIEKLYADVPALKDVTLGLHCSNACKLAPATVLESLSAGVGQIDLCCAGDQAPNVATVLAILAQRSEKLGVHTDVLYTEAKTCAAAAAALFDKKAGGKAAAVLQNEGESLALDANADKHTVLAAVAKLGYSLSSEDALRVYEEFGQIAASKPIGTRELDTIVAAVAMQVPATYKLVNYVINSGNTFSSSAHVTVEKSGKVLQAISLGDGPIDAAFKALEQIVGHHYELDDFQIHAVTEGHEAVGSALVKLRSEGTLHAGQGVSTDIIGASIRAYLDAINKIVYEEGRA
jgi:2-isopropylmalate synthase